MSRFGVVLSHWRCGCFDLASGPPVFVTKGISMRTIEVNPKNYFRDWDNDDDVDIITVAPNEVTEVTVRPLRHIAAEKISGVGFVQGEDGNYGPWKIGDIELLEDRTGWKFTVDAMFNNPPDEQHGQVFHYDTHSVAFWCRYLKLGNRSLHNRENWTGPFEASGSFGFYIITRPYPG